MVQVMENLKRAQEKQKRYADERRRESRTEYKG